MILLFLCLKTALGSLCTVTRTYEGPQTTRIDLSDDFGDCLDVRSCTFNDLEGNTGGCIYAELVGTAAVTSTKFANCWADQDGGACYLKFGGEVRMTSVCGISLHSEGEAGFLWLCSDGDAAITEMSLAHVSSGYHGTIALGSNVGPTITRQNDMTDTNFSICIGQTESIMHGETPLGENKLQYLTIWKCSGEAAMSGIETPTLLISHITSVGNTHSDVVMRGYYQVVVEYGFFDDTSYGSGLIDCNNADRAKVRFCKFSGSGAVVPCLDLLPGATEGNEYNVKETIEIKAKTEDGCLVLGLFSPSTSEKGGLKAGAIAGIVIGAVAVVGISVAVVIYCVVYRKKMRVANDPGTPVTDGQLDPLPQSGQAA